MEFKNIQTFNPSECISAKVMRFNRIVANIFRGYLRDFNITDSQLSILFVLTKKGGLNQKQLSQITILEKSSLNRNLKRLMERGYISRANFPAINITYDGKLLVEKVIPEWKRAMDELKNLLGEEGEASLNLILTKLLNKK